MFSSIVMANGLRIEAVIVFKYTEVALLHFT